LLHGLVEVTEQLQIIVVHHEHFVQDGFPDAQKVLDGYSSCFHAPHAFLALSLTVENHVLHLPDGL
jgi:hypothetical protein